MVELNRSPFRKRSAMSPIRDNLGTILTGLIVAACIFVSARMQKPSGPRRIEAQHSVVLEMAPTRSQGEPRRGADPLPQQRSSLEVRPIWGEVAGLEKPKEDPKPAVEEEEEEPEPEMPEPVQAAGPDFSQLMKGVQTATKAKMKAAEFGATTQGARKGSVGGATFQTVTSFEAKEAAERKAREEMRAASGPPPGAYDDPKNQEAMKRLKQAIERGGAPASMQKFGLDLPQLYQLQAGGVDMQQYLQPDGSLAISDDDAAAMASHLGLANMGPDKKTTDSAIRPGR